MAKNDYSVTAKFEVKKAVPDAHARYWRETAKDSLPVRLYQIYNGSGEPISDPFKYEYKAWNNALLKMNPEAGEPKETSICVGLSVEQMELCGGRQLLRKKILKLIRSLAAEARKDPALSNAGPETAVNRILSEGGYPMLKV
jgi:hypothetical protein